MFASHVILSETGDKTWNFLVPTIFSSPISSNDFPSPDFLCSPFFCWEWFHPTIFAAMFLLTLPTFDSSPSLTQINSPHHLIGFQGGPRALLRVVQTCSGDPKRNFLPLEMDTLCIVFWIRFFLDILSYIMVTQQSGFNQLFSFPILGLLYILQMGLKPPS